MFRRAYLKPEINIEELLNHNILLSSDTASDNFGDPFNPWGPLDVDDPGDEM